MRWIDAPAAYRAKAWRSEASSVDHEAEFARIEAEARKVTGRPAQIERRLADLRTEWRSVVRRKRFAETGSFE